MQNSNFYGRTWKPVSLNETRHNSGGVGVQSLENMLGFDKMVKMDQKRLERLKQYDDMDLTVEISRALDVIAEDISSDNADDDEVFKVDFPESYEPSNTEVKTINELLHKWERHMEFDYKFFMFSREMIKYGSVMFLINKDGSLTKLKQYRLVGYKVAPEDEDKVTHYIYKKKTPGKEKDEDISIPVEDMLVLKHGDGAFGESVLDRVYRVWKQLILLEDATVIYRIVRAPERRVFFIDVGRLAGTKQEKYVEQVKNRMKQKQIIKNGEIETNYNPASMQEDYFIGTNSEGRGSRIETLPGADNLGEIRDLNYFLKKLGLGLRIPLSQISFGGDQQGPRDYNDGRIGTQFIEELRYIGYIKRIQKFISRALYDNYVSYATRADVELPNENMFLVIALPQSFAIYKENELWSTLLNTLASADSIEFISNKLALEKFLHLDDDDVIRNEEFRLMELGYSEKVIKKMDDEVKMNLIYGDGTSASKLEDEEGAPPPPPPEDGADPENPEKPENPPNPEDK